MANTKASGGAVRTVEFDSLSEEGAEFLEAVVAYYEAKRAVKAAKEQQEKFEARIREIMGEANVAKIDGAPRASIAVRNRSNLDKTMIPEEIIAAATTNTTYTVLDAK